MFRIGSYSFSADDCWTFSGIRTTFKSTWQIFRRRSQRVSIPAGAKCSPYCPRIKGGSIKRRCPQQQCCSISKLSYLLSSPTPFLTPQFSLLIILRHGLSQRVSTYRVINPTSTGPPLFTTVFPTYT